MATVIGISGSLRQQSFNTALLRAGQTLMPAGSHLEVVTLQGIPLYDGDLEAREGIPAAVNALKEKIRAADGILLATPEYNNGIPGVVKNAFDWLSRPGSEIPALLGGRPMAIVGASPSGFGTLLAQTAWLPVVKSLGVNLWPSSLQASRAHTLFNEQGELVDDAIRQRLEKLLAGFVQFIEAS